MTSIKHTKSGVSIAGQMSSSNLQSTKIKASKSDVGLAIMMETDDYLRKWSGPLMIGPFLIALFSLITIVGGHIVLDTWTGYCGYSLDAFIGMAMFISYIFLMIFTWSFIGDKIWVSIPLTTTGFYLMTPFRSLKWLMTYYFILGFFSFIFWCVGTSLLQLGEFCVTTAPLLYSFSLYLVVTYWIGFFIVVMYFIKLKWGTEISNAIMYSTAAPTLQDAQEKIFRREFKKYDYTKRNKINKDDLAAFFVNVGVFVPDNEMQGVIDGLEPDDDGNINIHILLGWYKEYNAKTEGYGNGDEDDEDDG